jgi:hypothetical protein
VTDEVTARSLERYFKSGSGKAFAKKRFLGLSSVANPAADSSFAKKRRSVANPCFYRVCGDSNMTFIRSARLAASAIATSTRSRAVA